MGSEWRVLRLDQEVHYLDNLELFCLIVDDHSMGSERRVLGLDQEVRCKSSENLRDT